MSFVEAVTKPREWHTGANSTPADEKVLAGFSSESQVGIGLQHLVRELGRTNKHVEESGGAAKGTLGSIGRAEEQLVYMARGCDYFTVNLCPGLLGKDAF